LVKEADFEVVGEWNLHLRPSRAAAAKLAKPLGDVALEPYDPHPPPRRTGEIEEHREITWERIAAK